MASEHSPIGRCEFRDLEIAILKEFIDIQKDIKDDKTDKEELIVKFEDLIKSETHSPKFIGRIAAFRNISDREPFKNTLNEYFNTNPNISILDLLSGVQEAFEDNEIEDSILNPSPYYQILNNYAENKNCNVKEAIEAGLKYKNHLYSYHFLMDLAHKEKLGSDAALDIMEGVNKLYDKLEDYEISIIFSILTERSSADDNESLLLAFAEKTDTRREIIEEAINNPYLQDDVLKNIKDTFEKHHPRAELEESSISSIEKEKGKEKGK